MVSGLISRGASPIPVWGLSPTKMGKKHGEVLAASWGALTEFLGVVEPRDCALRPGSDALAVLVYWLRAWKRWPSSRTWQQHFP